MAPRLKFLPYALSKTLLNFQQEGILFGISKNGRCLIGDEMGLGKTLQALSIAYYYKNEWPLLIVCPSSMRFPWIEEIEKWLPDIQPGELNLVQSGTDASNIKTSKISIIGYGLLSHPSSRLLINCLKDTKFGVIVVDESHYMKNRKTARTKALVSVIKNVKRAVLLTGTPTLARPEELYVQIDVLKPCLLGSFSKFAERFCQAHTEYICGGRIQKWNTKGASNLDELHNILKTNVMIRRLKRHVLKQLPPKRRQKITFDLANSESKKQLADVIKQFRRVQVQIYNSGSSQNMEKNPVFELQRLATVLYKQTGLAKISAVRQYIADMLDNSDKKFLVFAHHLDVMKAIELEVVKKRVKYIRIAGDVPSVLRGSLVQQFQKDSSVRVAILSLLAASVGITLTAADHIIFTELHWTPGVMWQAEDRVHRIGQVNSVLVQYLVAKGTIDEVLWRTLCKKVYVTTATLNGKQQGLDAEEGSEGQSKLLEAFSAWVMEDEEEAAEEDCLFTHSQKKRKQDVLQRSLTEFFHSPSTLKCRKTDFGKEWSERQESDVNESSVAGKPSRPVVQVEESVVKEEEKDRPEELDILSGYTQLLSKPKLVKANVVNVSVESTGSNKLSKSLLDKPTNQTEIIDLTGEDEVKQYSDNTEPDESDKNQVDTNCVGVKHPRPRACDISASNNKDDLSDFKTSSSWCCGLCTFSNSGFLRVCEVCRTPRHRSRRKLPDTALSTPEFVKRQQQKILKRSVVAENKMKSFGRKIKECDVSEERSVVDETVRDISDLRPQPSLAEGASEHEERPNLESQDVSSFVPESPTSDDISEDLPMINPNTVDPGDNISSLAALSNEGTSDEFMTSGCESAEDVKAAVDELFLPGNEFDELTGDAALSNEGTSDEFMTSGCESAEDVKAAVDELFLPGNEFDELTAEDWWRCDSCFKYNYDESANVCEVCGFAKTKPSEHLEDLVPSFVVDWSKYDHLFIEDCEGEMGTPQAVEHLMFCVSCYTDRVYLYNENAEPLNCNVSLLDLDASNVENLPNLLIETSNKKQVMRFMRKWKALSERQRRMVRDTTVVFEDPYEAVEHVKTGRVQKSSTCRFPSKEMLKEEVVSAAADVNGTVRHCKKTRGTRHKGGVQQSAPPRPSNTSSAAVSAPSNPNQRTWIQAIDDSGRPLCMSCKSPVDTKNTVCQWDERFCSHKCKQDYQIRVSGSHVREKLFEEEHGVCQRCSLNAHDLYRTLRLLPKAERREHLENTSFLTLPVTLLNKIIVDPKEGMFWEADHVVPVVEGGGECGLDNYRTLCVPCHRDVTTQLRGRLRTNKRLAKPAGTPDITTFFNS